MILYTKNDQGDEATMESCRIMFDATLFAESCAFRQGG